MTSRLRTLIPAVAVLAACRGESAPRTAADSTAMPQPTAANAPAPAVFQVRFETSRGPFVVEAHRDWAPHGADRFYRLVNSGFFDKARFFRVLPGFIAQFGMHADPAVTAAWDSLHIPDDPAIQSNKRGFVTFAMAIGTPNSRGTQLFINFVDNTNLDAMGFAPIGQVVEGMPAVDSLYGGYGEAAPDGQGPTQERIAREGNAYLEKDFPKLDFIRTARVLSPMTADSAAMHDSAKK